MAEERKESKVENVKNNGLENKVLLSNYELFFENEMLCVKSAKNITILTPKNFGLTSFIITKFIKIDEKNAYIICSLDKVFLLKIAEKKDEIKVKSLELPFMLSKNFECIGYRKNILFLDFDNNKYLFLNKKRFVNGNIKFFEKAKPAIIDNIAIIINDKEVHIINNGLRSVLTFEKPFNTKNLIIKKGKTKKGTFIYLNDGFYEGKILIEKNGKIIYGERENIFFKNKLD